MADTLKFGPEWLRVLSDGGNVTSPPQSPLMSTPQYKLAEYRYGREEMLALLNFQSFKPPELDSNYDDIFKDKPSQPLALLPATEEEQRLLAQNVNSTVVLRLAGRGGSLGLRGGRGGSDRGRGRGGRGRDGTYFSSRNTNIDEDGGFGRGSIGRGNQWEDGRDSRFEKVFGQSRTFEDSIANAAPRKDFNRSFSTDNWRATNLNPKEDEALKSTDSGEWRRIGSKDKWSTKSSNGWKDPHENDSEHPNHTKGRFEGLSTSSRYSNQDRSRNNRTSGSFEEEDNLPEWSMNNEEIDDIGTFDSSGAFMSIKGENETSEESTTSSSKVSEDSSEISNSKVKKSEDKEFLNDSKNIQKIDNTDFTSDSGDPVELNNNELNKSNISSSSNNSIPLKIETISNSPKDSFSPKEEIRVESLADTKSCNISSNHLKQIHEEEDHQFDHLTEAAENMVAQLSADAEEDNKSIKIKDIVQSFEEWFYRDPQGEIQGPFSSQKMCEWFTAGYFSMTLLVRRGCDEIFVPLGELIESWKRMPFTPGPQPPPNKKPHQSPTHLNINISRQSNSSCMPPSPLPLTNPDPKQSSPHLPQKSSHHTSISPSPAFTSMPPHSISPHPLPPHQLGPHPLSAHPLTSPLMSHSCQSSPPPLSSSSLPSQPILNNSLNPNEQMKLMHQQMLLQQQNLIRQFQMKQIYDTLQQQEGFKQLTPQVQHDMINKLYVQHHQQLLSKTANLANIQRNVSPVPSTSPNPFIPNYPSQSTFIDAPQAHSSSPSKSPPEVTVKSDGAASIWDSIPSSLTTPTLGSNDAAIWVQNNPASSSVWDIEPLKSVSSAHQLLLEKQKLEKQKEIEKELERQRLIKAEEEEMLKHEEAKKMEFKRKEDEKRKKEEEEIMKAHQEKLKEMEKVREREVERQRQEQIKMEKQLAKEREESRRQEEERRKREELIRLENERLKKEELLKQQQELIKKLQEEQRREKEAKLQEEVQRKNKIKAEEFRRQQQEAYIRVKQENQTNDQLGSSSIWGSSMHSPPSPNIPTVAEIQAMEQEQLKKETERKKQLDLIQQQQLAAIHQSQQQNKSWSSQVAAPVQQPQPISLLEIQQEQSLQKNVETKKNTPPPASNPIPSLSLGSAAVWGSSNSSTWATEGSWNQTPQPGFYEDPLPSKKSNKPNNNSNNNSAFPALKIAPSSSIKKSNQNSSKNKNVKTKEEEAVQRLFEAMKPKDEFTKWCEVALKGMQTSVDVPTFIAFLQDVESPYEIHDYVRSYLGESREVQEFAQAFIKRRAQNKNQTNKVVYQNSIWSENNKMFDESDKKTDESGFEESKATKKKKKRMQKIDSSILGFTVQAAPDRYNVGEIDSVD